MRHIIFVLIVVFIESAIDFSESAWSCSSNAQQQSPIDIPFYNTSNEISFPSTPLHYINRTFYHLINEVILKIDENGLFSIRPKELNGNFGQLYATMNNDYSSYSLKEIRFHIYSEHTFEQLKTEVEMQLIHASDNVGAANSLDLAVAVFFSASWDTDSEFLKKLTETKNPDSLDVLNKYNAAKITSLDLNQFFIKHEPYYYYTGSGTVPNECSNNYHWFVMKKVQKMSWNQLYQLQSLMYKSYKNGNARTIKAKLEKTVIEYIESGSFLHF